MRRAAWLIGASTNPFFAYFPLVQRLDCSSSPEPLLSNPAPEWNSGHANGILHLIFLCSFQYYLQLNPTPGGGTEVKLKQLLEILILLFHLLVSSGLASHPTLRGLVLLKDLGFSDCTSD